LLMGSLLSEEGKPQEALKYINFAIDINPKDYRGYFLKAIVHDKMGQIVSAEADLKKALELNPGDPELLNHLGYSLLLWYGSARVEEAKKLISEALSKDKENPAYMDSYAWALYYEGDYQTAYEWLKKAYEREKEDPVINEHIGDVLLKLGRKEEARKYYEKALELLKAGKRGEPGQEQRLKEKLKD
ncbi:MAG: tetratricopeptide repeat protein, partial [Hydrogenobacter sp.]